MWQKTLSKLSNIVLSAVIMTALVAAVRVDAATVTSANDTPSTLQTSVAANHTVFFTTSSGVSDGSTITVHFDSAFSTSSLTQNDVDVADDGVELTTASNCSGTEKSSIAISSNTITVTICPGDGGVIASGSVVRIKIGTNAVFSGTGSHQITNPTSAGTYFASIAGTFGDSGSIALPIRSSADGIAVNAIVSGGGGGSGGTPGQQGQIDTTAPSLGAIVVSNVSKSDATISWTTNESSNTKVLYGLTSALETGFVFDAGFTLNHSIDVPGLSEGKTYYFQVKSADTSNNIATSSVMTFATLDQTPPVISNILVDSITKTSATITWSTNEAATSHIDYGLTSGYGSEKNDSGLTTTHTFPISGLQSGRMYHFRLSSSDSSSNIIQSSDETFVTLLDLPPGNVSGLTATAQDKSIALAWTNPTDDDLSGTHILKCLNAFPKGPNDVACTVVAENTQAKFLNLNNLTNGTIYYFGVFAKDSAGQFSSGALVSGQPSAPENKVPQPKEEIIPPVTQTVPVTEPEKTVKGTETTKTQQQNLAGGLAVPCGDGVCSGSESVFTCPSDCKQGQPSSLGTTTETFSFNSVTFSVGNGAIKLPILNGFIEVLPNAELNIHVPATMLGSGVDHVTLMIGPDTYLMRPVTTLGLSSLDSTMHVRVASVGSDANNVLYYEADVSAPKNTSLQPVTVFVDYKDGKTANVSSFLQVVAPGYTHEIIDGEEAPVGNAQVTLYSIIGSQSTVWDGSPYGENNPTISAGDGNIAWYVPNGQYRVHAVKDGYQPLDTAVFTVANSIMNPRMVLIALPKKPIVTQEPTIVSGSLTPTQTVIRNIKLTVKAIASIPAISAVSQSVEAIRQIPEVQTAAQVSFPTLAVSAGASVVVMSVAFDFLPFVQYLFTAPLLFLGRKKRKGFGVIYNAITKEPIGLAVVRLYKLADEQDQKGKLVKSRVTDKGGRFFFLVQPGLYRLTLSKNGFQFPSELMKTKKEDVQYMDLYHGEFVKVTEKDAVLTPNIPLDPSSADQFHEPKQIVFRARLQFVQHIVALSGTLASLVFAIIRPSTLAVIMVFLQLAIYLAVNRLAKPRKPKSWGIVYDDVTRRPIANAVARIFEPKYNKLLETQVTDNKGRYSFLLGPAEYFAVFEKEGYRSVQVRPIDYTKVDGAQDFSNDIGLVLKGAEI